MRKHLLALLLSLCSVALLPAQPASDENRYNIRHYSVEDGLIQNTVMSILQDKSGDLWLGTWNGLSRFNGYEFVSYQSELVNDAHAHSNRIDFIYQDSLEYIWIQTYDNKLYRFDKRTETFTALDIQVQKLSQYHCNTFIEPVPGIIWVAAENEVFLIDETDAAKPIQITSFSTGDKVEFLLTDLQGAVWYNTNTGICRVSVDGTDVQHLYPYTHATDNVRFVCACVTPHYIWLGTDCGDFWSCQLQSLHFEHSTLGKDIAITDIATYEDNKTVVMTTADAGFFVYDRCAENLRQYAMDNTPALSSNSFLSVTMDNHGIAWLENKQPGIFRFRFADNSLKHLQSVVDERFAQQQAQNLVLFEDENHKLWVNPYGGGFACYNYDTDAFEAPVEGITNIIHTAYSDRQGSIWISTYDKGIDRVDIFRQQFRLNDVRANKKQSGEVRAMLQLRHGDILLASKNGKVTWYDGNIREKAVLPITDLVYCMYEDHAGNIWFGTRRGGLYKATGSSPKTLQITHFRADGQPYSLSNDNIYAITEDALGRLYIGTYGGGVNIYADGRFFNSSNDWIGYPKEQCSMVRDLLIDGDYLYAATTAGLLQISMKDRATRFVSLHDVRCLHKDSDGNIWIGTFGGGLNKLLSAEPELGLQNFNVASGLQSDIVLSISEDTNGKLWFTSENAITRYDYHKQHFQYFKALIGEKDAYFTEAKALHTHSGQIFFGYTNGYCNFSPEQILPSDEVPPLQLTNFQISNNDVQVGAKGSVLKENIDYVDCLTLSHKQSVFSIEYAAIDFAGADRIQYAYMLEGFEDDWNYVHSQRKATYTNLPSGTYRFLVRSTNADGVWVDNTRSLTIKLQPSFWQTVWAFLLYILIAVLIIYIIYRIVFSYNKVRQEVQMEQKITDVKLRFFTNISHELRTPLTLISGPVENILKTEKISPSVRTQLEIVQSNSNRMLRLINEILDFRKLQSRKLRLKIQAVPFAGLIKDICANFTKEAYDKHINFQVENNAPDAVAYVDKDKVDVIVYNLLSNAFKFTPSGKSITVSVSEKTDFLLVKVKDEGVGIPLEKRSILFERFSSQNEIKNLSSRPGSGIGMNLVKELVDLHKGYIEVESEVNKGTTFTVMFKKGKDHFGNEVDLVVDDKDPLTFKDAANNAATHDLEPASGKVMLVVEDNDDMRSFLVNIFSKQFKVETAVDGLDGLEKAKTLVPEIIISDLMMPNMDGLELLKQLKSASQTDHIPIILLTAKNAIESKLESMNDGADDYITKPFSPEYLQARVDNILKSREKLQERYRTELLNLTPQQIQGKTPNEKFIAKLMDFMEKNMDNNGLVVEDLVNEMALGRTVFFNKLKSLTGLSPVEFIREVRIKRAAQLLEVGSYNITEVTYMVGMNDSRYFSKCFKAVYGMTPTEYKKSIGK